MIRSTPWIFICAFAAAALAQGEEAKKAADAADPFAGLDLEEFKEPAGPDFDNERGVVGLKLEDATYFKGDHSGRWTWPSFTPDRWGMYNVEVTYVSTLPKMGIQFYVGDAKSKGYLAQSGGMNQERTAIVSNIYLPDTQTHDMGILTGEDSNGPQFKLRGVRLIPAPEGKKIAQGIDGMIDLPAGHATTFSKKMRYEPKEVKNCLGFWADENDWAQWRFAVHAPGKFKLEVYQGCGAGNGGSEVGVWINDKEHKFTVADTGGFQNWEARDLGIVELAKGDQLVSIKPNNKTGSAVMDIHKVVLTPVEGE